MNDIMFNLQDGANPLNLGVLHVSITINNNILNTDSVLLL